MAEELGSVYFIQGKESKKIKIGFTKHDDVNVRLKQLQTGCSEELEVVYIIRNSPKAYERYLHKYFWNVRIRENGEWFVDKNKVISNFIRLHKLEMECREKINSEVKRECV